MKLFRSPYFILVFTFIFFSLGSFYIAFYPPDEPKYVDAALRMIEHSNYIIPFFNCHIRFDKPILYYLELVIPFKLFGVDYMLKTGHDPFGIIEYAAKIPSIISGSLEALYIYMISIYLFNDKKAAANSVIAYLSIGFFIYLTRAVYPDMSLIFFETAGIYYFLREKYIIGWVFIALAFLTKGPVGIVSVGFTYLLYLWIVKKSSGLNEFLSLPNILGIMVFLLISSPWYIEMYRLYRALFFKKFFLYHNIERFTGKAHQHPHSIFYYIPITLIVTYLWWPYLKELYTNINFKNPIDKFLLLWSGWILLFFSISANKLPHYIAPAFIPIAIIAGKYSDKLHTKKAGLLFFIIELTIAAGLSIYCYQQHLYKLIPVISTGFLILSLINLKKEIPVKIIFIKTIILTLTLITVLYIFESYRITKKVWITYTQTHIPIAFYRLNDQSIIAYTRQCIKEFKNPSKLPENYLILTKKKYLKTLPFKFKLILTGREKGKKLALIKKI